ncbi:MAG: tetratricopeptide repeat protein [Sandaracinaceae bacterium]|nr:tetratricopeptide repeat protein [Sandaracinaceae bacterium]
MVLVAVDVRVRVVLVALVFVAGLAWTPTLQAQAVSPATDNEEEARALFIAGRSAFDQGRFEEALSHFKRSYELSGRPELLYNIGTAADRVGRLEEAITAFRSYLEGSPDSPGGPKSRLGWRCWISSSPTNARSNSERASRPRPRMPHAPRWAGPRDRPARTSPIPTRVDDRGASRSVW